MTTTKLEGRTQLVAYAREQGLAAMTEARKMDLDHLRRVVRLHRLRRSIAQTIDDTATTAEKERT